VNEDAGRRVVVYMEKQRSLKACASRHVIMVASSVHCFIFLLVG